MAPAGDDLEYGSGNHAGFRRARPACFKHMMTPVWLRPVTVGLPPIPRGLPRWAGRLSTPCAGVPRAGRELLPCYIPGVAGLSRLFHASLS